MTDAERLAKAWLAVDDIADPIAAAQRLIDSGVVTVNPPPDPAEQIATAYMTGPHPMPRTRPDAVVLRRLIADGWIVPGPACEGVEPDAVTAAEREVIATVKAWVRAGESIGLADSAKCGERTRDLIDAVRALRAARP